MRWSSLILCLLLTLVPAPSFAEGVRPDLIPVVAPDSMLVGLNHPVIARTLCTADPSKERRWELRNLTGEAVTVTWQIVEKAGEGATLTLPGGGRTEVKVKAQNGQLTLRLLVAGEVVATSPNWGTKCAAQQPGQGLTWRKGPPPRAPVRPAKPKPGQSLTWQKGPPPKAPTRPAPPRPGQGLTWQKGAPPTPAQPTPAPAPTPPTPAPQPVVRVTPLCYRQPSERRWRVQNLTTKPLTLTIELEGRPRGQLILAPGGETDLNLEAVAPPNRLRLYANGQLVAEVPNPEDPCSIE